ncbi:MAG: ABC transporter permease [Candidatus Muproteobacteria bacterium RIFCSPHIGHO2_02_FULL_65_16]|uniref:ABC transporter permease n=1 Tax=Candidatus Muproteobacteria bacterium RIFCSPHIGHO2_02_FULL_65_16 TaxID=1817766 RepID=A0A1F6U6G3_9PROT|nr:MAG: ABC transporter permease [Candidatus Muproteobacteria bacterium RIFCSPHIGHO2_02_FULL_65_16]
MIRTIAMRELRALFLSPLAWTILAVVQLILAFLFLGRVELVQISQSQLLAIENAPGTTAIVLPDLLGNAAIILLLVTPLLTMRLVSEERRNRTLSLLFSAPVSMTEIILGKYVGIMLFLLLLLALIALMPLSLLLGGGLDAGLLVSGLLGLALLLAGFAAVGLFLSTMTQHPPVAAVGAFGALLLFWVLDWSGQGVAGGGVLAALSMFNHYKPFLDGVFDSADAAYHLLLVTTFLALSILRLDAERLGG